MEATKRCPLCGDENAVSATVCRYCNKSLSDTPAATSVTQRIARPLISSIDPAPGVASCPHCNVVFVSVQARRIISINGCLGVMLFLISIVSCLIFSLIAGTVLMSMAVILIAIGDTKTVMVCPRCGHRKELPHSPTQRVVRIAVAFIGVVIVLEVYGTRQGGNPFSSLWSPSAPATLVSESQFCAIVKRSIHDYRVKEGRTANEATLSNLRHERKVALESAVESGQFKEWIGTLKSVSTDRDGTAHIEIQLPCGGEIRTDTSDSSITPGSPLYVALSAARVGSRVSFDGDLEVRGPDSKDYVHEGSFTESGSMTDPEFIVSFSGLKLVDTHRAPVKTIPRPREPRPLLDSESD